MHDVNEEKCREGGGGGGVLNKYLYGDAPP